MRDLVWKNTDAKQRGFARLVQQFPDAVCIALSDKTKASWQRELAEKQLLLQPVEIKMAKNVTASDVEGKVVIFLEHNLSRKKEEDLTAYWKPLEVLVLNSLEDEIFSAVNAGNIVTILDKLGFEDDEMLEHPVITRSIVNIQRKNDEA